MAADVSEPHELYGLPLEEFTPARNELAARLRKAGERAAAEQVKSLPKPPMTAWALNQVARSQPKLVETLLDSAGALRRAQQQLLAGHNPSDFREATQQERRTVDAIVRAAAEILAKDEHPASKATLDRLGATARAAAADESNGELLRSGTLSRDLDPSGFGGLEAAAFGFPSEPIPFPRRPKHEPAEAQAAAPGADRGVELARARETVHELQQQLAALRKEASEAERTAAATRQAESKADHAAADAREALERAEREAERAHRAQEEAATELTAVRGRIDQTAEQLEEAEEKLRSLRA